METRRWAGRPYRVFCVRNGAGSNPMVARRIVLGVLNLRLFELKKGDSSRNKKTDPDDFSFLSQSGCRVPLAVANFQKA